MVGFLCSMLLLSGTDSSHIYLYKADRGVSPQNLVEEVLSQKCPNEKIEFKDTVCKNLVARDSTTKVCYINTDIGYFFVMRDMLDGVNIIYNRWD